MANDVPRAPALDSTIPLMREGYPYIARQCRSFHSDIFRGRLLGQKALFLSGSAAPRLFYDAARFRRADAVPTLIKRTLFGEGGVQGLDDEAHRRRKEMLVSLMTRREIARFLELSQRAWDEAAARLPSQQRIVLDEEAQAVLARAACAWVGLSLPDEELRSIASDCSALFTGFATVGPRMWRARFARARMDRWASDVIERVRAGTLRAAEGTPLSVVAAHCELDGRPLETHAAAVELINLIRPITAIGRWVTWIGLALHDHPQYAARVAGDDALADAFVQEVRRHYPFTPLLAARARRSFEWQGAHFEEGQLAVLDVYGILRDPRIWDAPETFRPERFLGREPNAYDYLPQGGGEFLAGHRCAGEWLTIEAMKQALRFLTAQISYSVPAQDLGYPLHWIPARPKSGLVLREVQLRTSARPRVDPVSVRGADGLSRAAH